MTMRVRPASFLIIGLLLALLTSSIAPGTGAAAVPQPQRALSSLTAAPPIPKRLRHTPLPPQGFIPAPLLRARAQTMTGQGAVRSTLRRARASLLRAAQHHAVFGPRALLPLAARLPAATTRHSAWLAAASANTPASASPSAPGVSAIQAAFFPDPDQNNVTFNATPLSTTVFSEAFPTIDFNPAPSQQSCSNDTGVTKDSRPFADVVPQADGSCTVQLAESADLADQAGVTNTVPGHPSLYAFQAVFTATLTIVTPGPTTFAFGVDDAFILSAGAGRDGYQPTVDPSSPALPSGTPTHGVFSGYPVMGVANIPGRNNNPGQTVTVDFNEPGSYPIELDYIEGQGDGLQLVLNASAGLAGGAGSSSVLPADQALIPADCPCDATQLSDGDPFNTRTGNMWASVTDLVVSSPGPALAWARTYSSQESGDSAAGLGPGWHDPYATRLITGNVTTIVSPEGNRLRFLDQGDGTYRPFPGVYDTLVRAGNTYTETTQAQQQVVFDAATGRATALLDAQGRALTLQYSGGQLAQITDAANQSRYLQLSYDGSGRISRVSDPVGRSVGYSYDAATGDLTGVTDVMNRTTTYGYQNHLLTDEWNPLGQRVEHTTYDTASPPRVSSQTEQDGSVLSVSYAAASTTVTTTAPDGTTNVQQILYDATSNTMTGVVHNGTTTQQEQVDGNFDVSASTDADNNTTATTYNSMGLPLTITNPLSGTTGIQYDAQDNPITVTDALGRQTVSVYDAHNDLIRQTTGITTGSPGLTTLYTYTLSAAGQPLLTDQRPPSGVVAHYDYNSAGQVVTTTVGYGTAQAQVSTTGYDAAGRPVTSTVGVGTPLQRSDVTRYNADDTVAQTIQNYTGSGAFDPAHPDQNVITSYGYDALGRQIWTRDALGHYTATHYNAAGQVAWTVRNLAPVQLDGTGQPIIPATPPAYSPAQPDANVAAFYGYDGLGRTTLVTQTGILTGTFDLATRTFSAATTRVTRTEYDAQSRPVTTTLNYQPGLPVGTLPDVNVQTVTRYDNQGNVTWQRDALGRWTETQYDALNRPVTTTVNYENGDPTTVDPANRSWTDGHDTDLIRVTRYRPDGTVDRDIDNYVGGQFTATEPITDRITQYGYDALGRPITTTVNYDPPTLGTRTDTNRADVTAYDPTTGQVVGQRDALGRWTTQQYDALGRVTTTVSDCTDGSGAPQAQGCAAFNPAVPDRNVPATTRYDALGRAFETVDALGHVTHTDYDGLGRATATIENDVAGGGATADQNVTTATGYDALGRTIVETDAVGAATSDGYDALGQTVAVTDAVGRVSRSGDDGTGVQRWSATPDGRVSVNDVDGLGRVITTTQNYSPTAPPAATDANLTTQTVYDAAGRRVRSVDAAGTVTAYVYDLQDHLIQEQDNAQSGACTAPPCNVLTTYSYDRAGHQVAITDPRGNTRTFGYDAADEEITATDALTRTTTWSYDLGGRMTTRHDPRGAADDVSYSYDGLDRLTQTASPGLPAPIGQSYDALGQRTSLTDQSGTTAYSYDALGRTTAITAPGTGTVGYGYNADGQRTSLRYPDGTLLAYSYDADGQMHTATQGSATLASYGYDSAGRLQQVTRANGAVTAYSYDGADRLRDLRTTVNGAVQSDFADSVNRLGQRTVVTETVPVTGQGGIGMAALSQSVAPASQTAAAPLTSTSMAPSAGRQGTGTSGTSGAEQAVQGYGQLPLTFEANRGQTAPAVSFVARGRGYTLFLTGAAAVLKLVQQAPQPRRDDLPGASGTVTATVSSTVTASSTAALSATAPITVAAVWLRFAGANPAPTVSGEEPLSGTVNYLIGNNPAAWHTGVPTYGRVRYHNVYPGIDLVYYGTQGRLEYDWQVSPGADPSAITLAISGTQGLQLDASGNLRLRSAVGTLTQRVPVAYQVAADGTRQPVSVRYMLLGSGRVGLALGAYDTSRPLVIDPVLSYSTYLGGGSNDSGNGIAVDASGAAYVTGGTTALDFPTRTGVYTQTQGAEDAFVTKLSPDGRSLVYSTYLGGSAEDQTYGIAVDQAGHAFVAGYTYSADYPTVRALYPSAPGWSDAVISELSVDGRSLVYSTYFGGSYFDYGTAIALDAQGNIYVAGQTNSPDLPTLDAVQPAQNGTADDAFLMKLSADGQTLLYSTYLGGSDAECAYGVAVDAQGRAYVAGQTTSSDFPTHNAVQASYGSAGDPYGSDAFAAALSADGQSLVYSTYLGGSGLDSAAGVAVTAGGPRWSA